MKTLRKPMFLAISWKLSTYRDELVVSYHGLPNVQGVVRGVEDKDHLHEVPLLDHGDYLAASCEGLDALTSQGDFGVVEELPLLEAHEDLGIDTLEVTILRSMLEAELFGLIQDVLS